MFGFFKHKVDLVLDRGPRRKWRWVAYIGKDDVAVGPVDGFVTRMAAENAAKKILRVRSVRTGTDKAE